MSGKGIENPYFKQLETTIREETECQTGAWISWITLTGLESLPFIEVALAQGTIIKRPSIRLNHDDERTKSLPEHEQYEYTYVAEEESMKTINQNSVERSSSSVPDEVPDDDAKQMELLKTNIAKMIKLWNTQRDDYNMRLDRFADNQYHGFTAHQ